MRGGAIAPHRVLRRKRRAPMTSISCKFSKLFGCPVVVASILFCPSLLAQVPDVPLPSAPQPTLAQLVSIQPELASPAPMQPAAVRPAAAIFTTKSTSANEHRFWDRGNVALFAGTAALSTADFFVTRANLQSGGRELNPVVRVFGRSSAGLAMNFAGETAGVIALTYFFHRTGHHRLERLVSVVNMSSSAGAVTYGMTHR
jgi:hypothetical protein